ncbi:hypothetical protein ACTPEF_25395, partial [Clostridioides difficile]
LCCTDVDIEVFENTNNQIGLDLGIKEFCISSCGEFIENPKYLWDLEANALVKKDNIKKEAKLFLDWAISDSAMDRYAHEVAVTS